MIGEVGVEIFRAFESVPDLCKLRTADVVIENLLSHTIFKLWKYDSFNQTFIKLWSYD